MSTGVRWVNVALPLLLVLSAGMIVAAVIAGSRRIALGRAAAQERETYAVPLGTGEPIAAEARVFRTGLDAFAIDPTQEGRRAAHPRTLARYRLLRAYPGAPPRIPHGLTPEEAQTEGCNTCHERGGFSERFGAYVPVTPHPELVGCLQCHVGDATLMAVPLPGTDPNARCRQCHSPGAMRWSDSAVVWKPLAWPQVRGAAVGQSPPVIPHGREFRENCLACHAAPAAVAEVTTSHPERANCRQCHLETNATTPEFTRDSRPLRMSREGGS